MINDGPGHLLYVEPTGPCTEPVIDNLTRRVAAAFHRGQSNGVRFRGWHHSACGANSDNTDYVLQRADGRSFTTNSLAIHYIACHRSEIPLEEIAKITQLPETLEDPTPAELKGNSGW